MSEDQNQPQKYDQRQAKILGNAPEAKDSIIVSGEIVKDNQIAIGNVMVLGLTFDHRAVDGVQAARFLETFIEMVQDPSKYAPIG